MLWVRAGKVYLGPGSDGQAGPLPQAVLTLTHHNIRHLAHMNAHQHGELGAKSFAVLSRCEERLDHLRANVNAVELIEFG